MKIFAAIQLQQKKQEQNNYEKSRNRKQLHCWAHFKSWCSHVNWCYRREFECRPFYRIWYINV